MNERLYYLYQNDEKIGPVSLEQLKQYNLNATNQVWWEGLTEWKYVKDVPEIASMFSIDKPNNKIILDKWLIINIFIQIFAIFLPLSSIYEHYGETLIAIMISWRVVSLIMNIIAIVCVYKRQYIAARVLAIIACIPTLPIGVVGVIGINKTIRQTEGN